MLTIELSTCVSMTLKLENNNCSEMLPEVAVSKDFLV